MHKTAASVLRAAMMARRPWVLCLALVWIAASPPRVAAQGQPVAVALELNSSRASVEACSGQELRLTFSASIPAPGSVGGYELVLRFPAEAFEAIGFEPGAAAEAVHVNGPEPFGAGFTGCDLEIPDPWDDGLSEDVVVVIASSFGSGPTEIPATGTAILGTVVFQARSGARPGNYRFVLGSEGCSATIPQSTALFDGDGTSLQVAFRRPVAQVAVRAPILAAGLACTLGETEGGVQLKWDPPTGGSADGFAIYRNGSKIGAISLPFIREYLDLNPPFGAVDYEVAVVSGSLESACRAACRIDIPAPAGVFLRGDVNHDGKRNISDPILLLNHLFLGKPVPCKDAADFDDSGFVELTDGILLLDYLFNRGTSPPPPLDEPGADPTADALDCGGA